MNNRNRTFTNVKDKDPESDTKNGWYYPQVKTFTAGVSMNF